MEGDHIAVALLRPVVVDEPVADGPGGVGQEGAPISLIGQHCLVEGQHGDAQLVLVAVSGAVWRNFTVSERIKPMY